jgi:hypothetical protein
VNQEALDFLDAVKGDLSDPIHRKIYENLVARGTRAAAQPPITPTTADELASTIRQGPKRDPFEHITSQYDPKTGQRLNQYPPNVTRGSSSAGVSRLRNSEGTTTGGVVVDQPAPPNMPKSMSRLDPQSRKDVQTAAIKNLLEGGIQAPNGPGVYQVPKIRPNTPGGGFSAFDEGGNDLLDAVQAGKKARVRKP